MSYRYVPVLAPGAVDLLVTRLLDASDDHAARLRRIDHVVDHRPTRRQVRVDLLAYRLDQLGSRGLRVVRGLNLLVEDDVDRPLRAHHRDLGERPGDDGVRLVALAVHDVVTRAVRLAQDHRDLRHRRLRGRVEHLRAVPDDAFLLDL